MKLEFFRMEDMQMVETLHSPRILALSWGVMEVEDLGHGRDFKLWPGGGRSWDWAETHTHHQPGIQPADVLELVEHGARHIVLSRGQHCRLQTCPETLTYLEDAGVAVHVEETHAAVRRYNQLTETSAVGGLFHSTC